MSSREVQTFVGEPSRAMRYTSDPPLAPPPGNGNGPAVCGALGAGAIEMPGAGVVPVATGVVVPRLRRADAMPVVPPPPRFSPTAAAKIFPERSTASAVISFLGALYSTNPSPAGEMR